MVLLPVLCVRVFVCDLIIGKCLVWLFKPLLTVFIFMDGLVQMCLLFSEKE